MAECTPFPSACITNGHSESCVGERLLQAQGRKEVTGKVKCPDQAVAVCMCLQQEEDGDDDDG